MTIQDLDVERALLGCFLLWNQTYRDNPVVVEDWSTEAHKRVYLTCGELLASQQGFDTLTLAYELKRAGNVKEVGGEAYLCSLTDGVLKSMAPKYAAIVKSKAKLRRLAKLLETAQDQAEAGLDLNDILRELEMGLKQFREVK